MLDNRASFKTFDIHPAIKQGLIDSGHYRATPIQEMAISQKDRAAVLILSPSGTGKTCAFSILMLNRILQKKGQHLNSQPKGFINGLVLAPTPELCQQISKEMQLIGRHIPLSIFPIISSIKLEEDWQEINHTHIVVATPGIALKLIMKKKLKMSTSLITVVIDEWDKMLSDEGLNANVTSLFSRSNPLPDQIICSSATYSQDAYVKLNHILFFKWHLIKSVLGPDVVLPNLSSELIDSSVMPATVTVDTDASSVSAPIRNSLHLICRAGSFNKRLNLMIDFFRKVDFYQALIFCNIHQFSKDAEIAINEYGFPCCFVSAQMDQRERLDKISEFRDMQLRCLISTDITARGLDVQNVNLVVSLDFPYEDQTFLHRIGRAGRFMSNQISLTFYKRSESKRLTQLHDNYQIDFSIYNKDHPPHIELLPLQNELLLNNYTALVGIADTAKEQEIEAEKEAEKNRNVVPMMFYCDKDGEYWDVYAAMCQQYQPPFV